MCFRLWIAHRATLDVSFVTDLASFFVERVRHSTWHSNYQRLESSLRIKGQVVNQVHQVRCGILEIWVCVTGSTRCVRRIMLKVSSGSDPTYESLDPVSKVVNWSQHPLQDPIHKGRSVFKQSPGIIGMEVYVQWAILCRRWRHDSK